MACPCSTKFFALKKGCLKNPKDMLEECSDTFRLEMEVFMKFHYISIYFIDFHDISIYFILWFQLTDISFAQMWLPLLPCDMTEAQAKADASAGP